MKCPGDVVLREVVGAVASVPGVLAAGPGQLIREGGDEVVERPGHDGVVVGANVKGDDTDGVTNPWEGGWREPSVKGSPMVKEGNRALQVWGCPFISFPKDSGRW